MIRSNRQSIYTSSPNILDDGSWDFKGEDTQQYLHDLHPYPAKFIPQIPRKAIELYTQPGQIVFDPFSGCGTTLLEAVIANRTAVGIDNNAVACLVSRAKTTIYDDTDFNELEHLLSLLNCDSELVTVTPNIPDCKNLEYWFAPSAIEELGKLRSLIFEIKGKARDLALTVFSSIIVSVSYQDSDTRYSRKLYDYPSGKATSLFRRKLTTTIKEAQRTVPKIQKIASVYQCDGRTVDCIPDKSVDLIVTSPPYLNAYDYHKYHRHRLVWINGNVALARDVEIGKHDTFTRKGATPDQYFSDMAKCFSRWSHILNEDGMILIVIGDAIVSGNPVPVADNFIDTLSRMDFFVAKHWIRNIDTNRKSFNKETRIKQEHILLFKR